MGVGAPFFPLPSPDFNLVPKILQSPHLLSLFFSCKVYVLGGSFKWSDRCERAAVTDGIPTPAQEMSYRARHDTIGDPPCAILVGSTRFFSLLLLLPRVLSSLVFAPLLPPSWKGREGESLSFVLLLAFFFLSFFLPSAFSDLGC